ncbi:hypothetical protein ACP4OV_021270 [Aristida adscensionis]
MGAAHALQRLLTRNLPTKRSPRHVTIVPQRTPRGGQQHEAVAAPGGGGAVAVARRGRWFDDEPPTTTAAAGWRCRSCAAVAIADCVALGCCPCAFVTMLGLALVKAPLAVGRRCVGRLMRRRRLLLHKKRVRDVAASAAAASTITKPGAGGAKAEAVAHGVCGTPPRGGGGGAAEGAPGGEAGELVWLEEMYRVGHWGFGRVSVPGGSP